MERFGSDLGAFGEPFRSFQEPLGCHFRALGDYLVDIGAIFLMFEQICGKSELILAGPARSRQELILAAPARSRHVLLLARPARPPARRG